MCCGGIISKRSLPASESLSSKGLKSLDTLLSSVLLSLALDSEGDILNSSSDPTLASLSEGESSEESNLTRFDARVAAALLAGVNNKTTHNLILPKKITIFGFLNVICRQNATFCESSHSPKLRFLAQVHHLSSGAYLSNENAPDHRWRT